MTDDSCTMADVSNSDNRESTDNACTQADLKSFISTSGSFVNIREWMREESSARVIAKMFPFFPDISSSSYNPALPGAFFGETFRDEPPKTDEAKSIRRILAGLSPGIARKQLRPDVYIPEALASCSHVWVRRDQVQSSRKPDSQKVLVCSTNQRSIASLLMVPDPTTGVNFAVDTGAVASIVRRQDFEPTNLQI
ncbi:hypothetical protein Ciccas_011817 [Cichlidogyrus casuarinus]|uniref:Gag-pol polyprotein n=1 Tax=Cichlidogyrus casuarinus TaxID=1844966 RepID=A0ABD2PQ50_9PLAT